MYPWLSLEKSFRILKRRCPVTKYSRESQGEISRMAASIARRFKPHQIILFGSHATGKARPDSDVDLLVVMPFRGSRRVLAVRIGVAVHGTRLPKDIVVSTPAEFAWRRDVPGTVEWPASREGKVLYARP
jgi:predicted nucleotidyltransferase